MKRISLTLAMLAAALFTFSIATNAWAAHTDYGCHNCHVPHHSGDPNDPTGASAYGVPLWSNVQQEDAALPTYTLYSSGTFKGASTITQPDGPSKLCLGCHDGSYSHLQGAASADKVFGPNDLANTHPVSFAYDSDMVTADGHLNDPATAPSGLGGTIATDLLDSKGKMQCTSCHDIHTTGVGDFMLRVAWDPAAYPSNDQNLCRICHQR